jgi:hypothetical protein
MQRRDQLDIGTGNDEAVRIDTLIATRSHAAPR